MPIDPKTVTVFLDASPFGRMRAAHAVALARRWGAHLVGVHAVFARVTLHPSLCYARGASAIDQVIIDEREIDAVAEASSVLLASHFRALCANARVSAEFRQIRRGHAAEDAVLRSLNSDLVVLGHPEPDGLPEDMSPERLLRASGVPLLIVPNGWGGGASEGGGGGGESGQAGTIGHRILIGWNGTRQARRAVSDAMAFLVAAESVTVLVVGPIGHDVLWGGPGEDIIQHLARHGVRVGFEQVASHGAPTARVILRYAERSGSDLLVVGAYSHARLRELVLGGTTRELLAQMPVPVLISR